MQAVDLLLINAIVVTMDAAGTVWQNGAVAIRERNIVAVGPTSEIATVYHANETVDCGGCAIIPGLINGHCHVPMSLLRGLVADVQLDVWLHGYMFPVESRFVDEEFVYTGTQLSCAEMLRGGTTCFVDMYFFEDEVARAADEAGIRAICGQTVMRFPTPDAASYDEGLDRARGFIHSWQEHERITPTIAPHAPYTCTDEIYQAAVQLAREYDVPLVTHLAETGLELKESLENVHLSPVGYAERVGAFDIPAIAAHCVHTDERDWAILRSHGVGAVPCPSSNLKLASGVAPYAGLVKAGVSVGLGTDGPASNDDQDMWNEIHLAALLPKGLSNDPTLMPAKQALALATSSGAKAIHMEQLIGSLEPGKRADIAVVALHHLHTTPQYHYNPDGIYSQLVYAAHNADVRHTLVDGRFLLRDGVLLTMDAVQVRRNAQAIADNINGFLSAREVNLLDKIVAIGGVKQDEIFEVQAKAKLVDEALVMAMLNRAEVRIDKQSERTQYDTYFSFVNPDRGRVRYREDHRHDPGARLDPKYTLTLTVPAAERDQYPHAILLSRARYTAPADRSLRFYREYFAPEQITEVEKQRRRWRITYRSEEFAVNLDRLINQADPGPFLEIKARTWSERDAAYKAKLIGELLEQCGVFDDQLIRYEYVDLARA
ncbi:MAG: amidohydrolase family protein [Herpetosiphonaceae bacterium]|nr:amidohydrolase family protein [Herpetosiphonaceae bacterium]